MRRVFRFLRDRRKRRRLEILCCRRSRWGMWSHWPKRGRLFGVRVRCGGLSRGRRRFGSGQVSVSSSCYKIEIVFGADSPHLSLMSTVTVGETGQIALPKELRERYGISSNTPLRVIETRGG